MKGCNHHFGVSSIIQPRNKQLMFFLVPVEGIIGLNETGCGLQYLSFASQI